LVASDYSVDKGTFNYQVLSFIFANRWRLDTWARERIKVRSNFLPGGKRMKFSDLNSNGPTKRALIPFLKVADWMPGILVTFAIHKNFHMDYGMDLHSHYWNLKIYNKVLTICYLISFFIGGLSEPGQNILWITDNDPIVANDSQKNAILDILGDIVPFYTPHVLHNFIGATASNDNLEKRELEDILSIPDLVAGAVSEYLTKCDQVIPVTERLTDFLIPNNLSDKTKQILAWHAIEHQPLKRMVITIIPMDDKRARFTTQIIKFIPTY
jgi:hypothetical protein